METRLQRLVTINVKIHQHPKYEYIYKRNNERELCPHSVLFQALFMVEIIRRRSKRAA